MGWLLIGVDVVTHPQDIRAAGTLGIPNNGGARPINSANPLPQTGGENSEVLPEIQGVAADSSSASRHLHLRRAQSLVVWVIPTVAASLLAPPL
ncbi:MAG: hypothetical protein HC767_06205 [Akkermansiaceae bacterium]|nr:hypothetical protein [Akkermansiaceae bacterium]